VLVRGIALLAAVAVAPACSSDAEYYLRDAGGLDGSRWSPMYDGGPTACAPDAARLPDGGCATGNTDAGTGPADAAPPPPCNLVTFRYTDPAASTVWLTGTFTMWAATPAAGAIELHRGADNVWQATVTVEPRGMNQYKFIVDSTRWIADPADPDRAPDGVGGFNSVINVCGTSGSGSCGDPTAFDWRDAVLYFAMVDRFADSDGHADPVPGATGGDARTGPSAQYAGGDLRGVTSRMSYLADLGVTALWISAPYENRNSAGAAIDPSMDPHMYSAFHGYWPSPANVDYTDPRAPVPAPQVESRIGTAADLHAMVDAAHGASSANGHGIRVLFDYVMKHADTESGLYQAHNDWFVRDNGRFRLCGPENLWDDPYWGTRCAFTDYLAPFDYDNPAPRAWSVNDAAWWAREFQIDGYRLDAIKNVPIQWLRDVRARMNTEFTSPMGGRFYMVGETFAYDDQNLIRSFVDPTNLLDGQFDFPFKARVCEALFTPAGRLDGFASWMDANAGFYGAGAIMSTFIGNHDIPRAIHFASRQIGDCRAGSNASNGWNPSAFTQPTDVAAYERLSLAFAVMLTNPGVPLIYYGDEVGLAGGGDPDNRRMMVFDDAALSAPQRALRERVRTLARIRAQNPVLGRGARTTLSADQDTWVYRMSGCGAMFRDVVVAINRGDSARSVSVPAGTFHDLLADQDVAGGSVSVPPRSFLVYRATP
jgi:glycosidase